MPDTSLSDSPRLLVLPLSSGGIAPEALAGGLALLPTGAWRGLEDIAEAGTALAAEPGLRLLLLCPRPEAWVAEALAKGVAPALAVRNWCRDRQPLMALLRARRRQVVLLFGQSLPAALPACAQTLGLTLPQGAETLPAPPATDPVLAMIVREALRRDPAAQAMAEEFAASALTPPEAEEPPEATAPDTVFAAYAALLERLAQAEAARAAERTRAEAAEACQADVEQRLAGLQAECEGLGARLDEARREAQARQAQAEAALAAERTRAEAETALLRDQIRLDAGLIEELQGRLAAEIDRGKAAEARGAEAEAQRLALAEKLAAAERAGRDRLERAMEEQEQMVRQLRAQIHQMGQGLESYHAQVESLEAERADLLEQVRQMQETREDLEGYYDRAREFSAQVEVLTAELQMVQALLAERGHHLEWLQDEIGRIHRSRSYRLTAPLRRIRKIVG